MTEKKKKTVKIPLEGLNILVPHTVEIPLQALKILVCEKCNSKMSVKGKTARCQTCGNVEVIKIEG